MPVSMANQLAAAHAATAVPMAMDHCAGQQDTTPAKPHGSFQGCAMACAAIEPTAFPQTAQASPIRSILSPRPSPRLDGIAPAATIPPPRAFPEI